MNSRVGFVALLLTGLIYGSFGIFIRFISVGLGIDQQIFARNLIAFIIAFAIIIVSKRDWRFKKYTKDLVLFAISFQIAAIAYTYGVLQAKIAIVTLGLYSGSLITSLILGTFIFHEKISRVKITSLLLTLLGLVALSWPISIHSVNMGLALGILSGATEGIANGFRKSFSGKVDRIVVVAIQVFGGVLIGFGFMAFSNQLSIPVLAPFTIGMIIILGILLVATSYLIILGFQNFDLNLGTIVMSTELVFAPVLAILFFREIPTLYEIIGGICIIIAVIIPNISFSNRKRKKSKIMV